MDQQEILFVEYDEVAEVTDKPHCDGCFADATDTAHCDGCRGPAEVTDKPHCDGCY